MKKPSYFNHLLANWRVAAHALSDFAEHFLHGLLPCISWRHEHEPAVPVIHAHWTDKGSLSCRCSHCGCKASDEFPYCPHCGARMDEEHTNV